VLRYDKGFGLFDAVRFGLWLARGWKEAHAAHSQTLGKGRGYEYSRGHTRRYAERQGKKHSN
jgi:hypothetical protein